MKLREYLDRLNEMVFDNPECLEYDVITAKDDGDGGYQHAEWMAIFGMMVDGGEDYCNNKKDWDEDQDFCFDPEDRIPYTPNSVRIN